MKKVLWKLMACVAVVCFSLSLNSCGDDDDVTVSKDALIGTWSIIKDEGFIKSDGEEESWNETYAEGEELVMFTENTVKLIGQDTGSYSYKGNKITMDFTKNSDEQDVEVWTVLELNATKLVMEIREKEDGYDSYEKVTCKKQ